MQITLWIPELLIGIFTIVGLGMLRTLLITREVVIFLSIF